MKKLKFGVIGYGNMGTSHVKNLMEGKVPNAELAAVCDISPERLKVVKESFPNIPVFLDSVPAFPECG